MKIAVMGLATLCAVASAWGVGGWRMLKLTRAELYTAARQGKLHVPLPAQVLGWLSIGLVVYAMFWL